MKDELTLSDRVNLVLKASMDFNSIMLHLHTYYSGVELRDKDFKKYMREVMKAEKEYSRKIELLTGGDDEK